MKAFQPKQIRPILAADEQMARPTTDRSNLLTLPMPTIPARHNRIGEEVIYRLLVESAVWRQFSRVWLKIDGPLPHPGNGPLICYPNHTSWWDGYAAMLLHRKVFHRSFEAYLMMDERQLYEFPFFSWLGVFSINLGNPREMVNSVNYIAATLAERRDRYLWIFPQGALIPNEQRPLHLFPGLAKITRKAGGATMWPVALRYEFRNEQQPELFIRCGPLHQATIQQTEREILAETTQRLTAAVDALRDEVTSEQFASYRLLMQGAPGINRIGGALLAAMPRRRTGA